MFATTALNDFVDFPYVAQVCRIERQVPDLKSGIQRYETVFAVTSPQRLRALNRGHWSMENRSHYVRDVTFAEDRSRIRVG